MRFSGGGVVAEIFPGLQKPTRFGGGGGSSAQFFFSVTSKRHFSVNGALFQFFTFPKGGPGPLAPPLNRPLQCLCYLHLAVWQRDMDYLYSGKVRRLAAFLLRSIRRILGLSSHDKVTNADVLSRVGLPNMYTLIIQSRLLWLGHVRRMEDGRIPKDIIYSDLAMGRRTIGRPHLRYKDV